MYTLLYFFFFFVFKRKTAYEMRISDWSSDVCSSDLAFRKRPNLSSENLSFFGRFEGAARFRGQSLTVDSVADSRLAFGGSLGRADRRYRRRMGSDRGASAA